MADSKDYPEFQYSAFLDKAQKEQIVIRTDDWDKFVDHKKKIDAIIKKRKASEPKEKTYECGTCGAEAVKKSGVKDGKTWSGIFCTEDTEHKPKWL